MTLFMSYAQKFQLNGWWVITENFHQLDGHHQKFQSSGWVITENFHPLGGHHQKFQSSRWVITKNFHPLGSLMDGLEHNVSLLVE